MRRQIDRSPLRIARVREGTRSSHTGTRAKNKSVPNGPECFLSATHFYIALFIEGVIFRGTGKLPIGYEKCAHGTILPPSTPIGPSHSWIPMKTANARGNARQDTVDRQRNIQRQVDKKDQRAIGTPQKSAAALQDGSRVQPQRPMPGQHLQKPGIESEMSLRPRFMAPDYKGSAKLQNMVALITGGDSGIGRAVAVLFAREGADVAIVYLCEHGDAHETREHVEAEGRRCLIISGDVKNSKFCASAIKKTLKEFGRLDVLVNNAAFQEHANSLESLSEDHFDETIKT